MIAFLEQDELYPILCGYFNKIFQSLLNKQKKNFFEYVFLERNGDLFDKLMEHIEYHSLAQLLIELMQVTSIYGGAKKENGFVNFYDEPDNEATEIGNEKEKSPTQNEKEKRVEGLLNMKQKEIAYQLIQKLSWRNTNAHEVLDAQSVLIELAECESSFPLLIQKDCIETLIDVTFEPSNENNTYGLHVFSCIIKQFQEYANELAPELSGCFKQMIADRFLDITYSVLIILNKGGMTLKEERVMNQSGVEVRPIGLRRMRALEFLKQ